MYIYIYKDRCGYHIFTTSEFLSSRTVSSVREISIFLAILTDPEIGTIIMGFWDYVNQYGKMYAQMPW